MNRVQGAEQLLQVRALVDRLRVGEVSALEALIDVYATQLRQIAVMIVRRNDIADDVVQETFVSLWERRATLPPMENVTGYLCRMARNIALKTLRHEMAEERVQQTIELGYRVGYLNSSTDNNASGRIEADELAIVVHQVLNAMQPQVREVFLLRRSQGLSYEEIATTLDISVVSVRSQMSRAMKRLAEVLKHS